MLELMVAVGSLMYLPNSPECQPGKNRVVPFFFKTTAPQCYMIPRFFATWLFTPATYGKLGIAVIEWLNARMAIFV